MSNVVHYYYPAPTLHHHPKHGRIKIGNILTDFTKPEDFKARGPAIPPPEDNPQTDDVRDVVEYGGVKEVSNTKPPNVTDPASSEAAGAENLQEPAEAKIPSETTISWQKTAEISTAQLRAGKVGVWAKIFSFGGASVGLEWTEKHDEVFNFENVITVEFWPSDDYITKCVSSPKIKSILQLTNYKKPLYLITGVKTITGAKAKTEESASRDVKAAVTVDATGPSGGTAPAKAGPELEHKKENKVGISFEESSDFVFAFKIKKITVDKKTKAEHTEDLTRGALLGQEEALASLPFKVEAVADAGPEDLGYVGENDAGREEDATAGATSAVAGLRLENET
jgi:hypothetical protein